MSRASSASFFVSVPQLTYGTTFGYGEAQSHYSEGKSHLPNSPRVSYSSTHSLNVRASLDRIVPQRQETFHFKFIQEKGFSTQTLVQS